MDANKTDSSLHEAVDGSIVWLISFGDLLTLLFCFFLVLTPRLGSSILNHSTKEGVSSAAVGEGSTGTRLATQDQGAPEVSIGSFPITVEKAKASSSEERRKQIGSAFQMLQVKAGSQLSSARVKVCEGASSGENMVHLYTEAQRVYGKLHAFEFEYATQCNKAAYHVNDDVDLMAVIEFSM